MTELYKKYIRSACFYKKGGSTRLIVETDERCRSCSAEYEGKKFDELYNLDEPYDFFTHVFDLPEDFSPENVPVIAFTAVNCEEDSECFDETGEIGKREFPTENFSFAKEEELIAGCDNSLHIIARRDFTVCEGVDYALFDCENKNGAPVKIFGFFIDTGKASLYCGTPDDGYEYVDKKQTVEGEARSAMANGVDVIGAVNADFFDMFGDCRPSGLCIKNGRVIANAESKRPFFAVLKNGKAVIEPCADGFDHSLINHAVSGYPVVLKDGEPGECEPGEPFGKVCHPRTCIGTCPDGKVIVLVIDGRIPDYSNGASLYDEAMFIKSLGAADALNLDGGGSCTFLVRSGDGFDLLNNPADLFRPNDRLIRDLYDSLLIVKM